MSTTKKYVSLEKLGLYDEKIKKVVADGDAATLDAAKSYANGLAVNYDAAGAAATAEANAKAHADGKDAAIQAAHKAGTDAAAAAAVADGKAIAAQGEVDALESYVGTFTHDTAKSVVEYINAKTDGIATSGNLEALGTRVTAVEGDVATIKANYLDGEDKTELEGKIAAVQTAVDTEKSRAEGEEAKLVGRIKAVEDDYLKATDKTELQGNIDTVANAVELLTNGVKADEVDGVNDLIQYVKEHGATVTGLQDGIDANAEAIEGVAGRMTTAEGKITAVEGAVATKVEQSVYDEKIAELAGADTSLGNRITTLEGKFGGAEGSVEDMIADAKSEVQGELATAIADAKTDASNKDAVVLAEAQKGIGAVQTAIDTHTGNADIHVTADDKTKWNAALQAADITAGTANGTISVKGSDVAVTGLGSAAYVATTAFDASGSAAQALTDAKAHTDAEIAKFVECSQEDINGLFA